MGSPVAPPSPRWRGELGALEPRQAGRVAHARASAGGVACALWGARPPHGAGLRSGRIGHHNAAGTGPRGGQTAGHPARRAAGVARCRGRPADRQERTGPDRRHHGHPEDGHLWVQQAPRTAVADAGDGRAPVSPFLQSAQSAACSRTGQLVRRKGIGADSTTKTAPGERQEAPHGPQRSFATRSIYSRSWRCQYNVERVIANRLRAASHYWPWTTQQLPRRVAEYRRTGGCVNIAASAHSVHFPRY